MTVIAFHANAGDAHAEVLTDREACIRLARDSLSAGGPALARYENGTWNIGTQPIARITFQGSCRLEIQINGVLRQLGRFAELCLIGDLVVSFDGPLARYAGEGGWRLIEEPQAAPVEVERDLPPLSLVA